MRFWTNKISTNSSGGFSKLIEKIAADRAQVKTASVKEAEKTEPANTNDVEVRTDVHSLEGLEKDQNGEPEADGEKKVVDAPSLKASAEETVKEAQIAAPAAKPQPKPMAPAAKPGLVPGKRPPAAPGAVAAKPAAPVAKPAVPGVPAAKPSPVAAKPGIPVAAKPAPVAAKPAVPGLKPALAPKSPALAQGEGQAKVADAPALGKGEGDGEKLDGVTKGRFPEPDRDEMYKQEPEEDGAAKTNKEAATRRQFVRIANLTPKAKSWLKRYWSMLYPSPYPEAMTQDK